MVVALHGLLTQVKYICGGTAGQDDQGEWE